MALLDRVAQHHGVVVLAILGTVDERDAAFTGSRSELVELLATIVELTRVSRSRCGSTPLGTGQLSQLLGAAGLVHGRRLWFGTARTVGKRLAEIADDLGISLHASKPDGGR